jgi:zinc/manganese transport system permease protein
MSDILIPALTLSIVLLVIHSYFGIEIIKRGIIFTDLSIGQMAAAGAAASLFFFEGQYRYLISLSFALITAILITVATKKEKVSVEGFIGLIYAFGISLIFIIMSKSPHGLEELNNLLAYDILFVNMKEVYKTAILYTVLGLFLFFISRLTAGFIKEILFFSVFSITITSSVSLAGVFVVFSLLIAPAFTVMQFFSKNLIFYAVILGSLINLLAVYVSYNFDLPTGYTIVFFQTFLAILSSIFSFLRRFH